MENKAKYKNVAVPTEMYVEMCELKRRKGLPLRYQITKACKAFLEKNKEEEDEKSGDNQGSSPTPAWKRGALGRARGSGFVVRLQASR